MSELKSPIESLSCEHGYALNECPHPATMCGWSHEYEAARHVPPPAGAWVHPKVLAWHEGREFNER